MNRSIVITRYATALVKYVRETGQGDIVCSEAEEILKNLRELPDLRRMVSAASDVVSGFDKKKLLQKVKPQAHTELHIAVFLLLCQKSKQRQHKTQFH